MIENVYLYYKQLSPSVRYGLVTGTFILAFGILFLILFSSKNAEMKSLQLQIKEVEKNILNGKHLQARCKFPADDEKRVWNEVKEKYYERIPPEQKVLELVKEIAKTALDCSIYDISFSTPTVPGDASGYITQSAAASSVPVAMSDAVFNSPGPALDRDKGINSFKENQIAIKTSFHCNYRELAHFLEAISRLPRILEMEALTIERKVPLMKVEMTINAFYAEVMEDA